MRCRYIGHLMVYADFNTELNRVTRFQIRFDSLNGDEIECHVARIEQNFYNIQIKFLIVNRLGSIDRTNRI